MVLQKTAPIVCVVEVSSIPSDLGLLLLVIACRTLFDAPNSVMLRDTSCAQISVKWLVRAAEVVPDTVQRYVQRSIC